MSPKSPGSPACLKVDPRFDRILALQENSRKNPTLFQRLAGRLPLILRFVGARHAYQQGEAHDY
jgi:3'-phosphoadenosine 5'-phosphosulfate sulfotransferase